MCIRDREEGHLWFFLTWPVNNFNIYLALCLPFHISTAESQDPSQVLAYVNEMNMVSDQELGEMELMKKTRAERKLKSWASPDQVLSLNKGVYSWTSLREALETPWASAEEVQGLTKNDRREVDKHLDKVVKESREGNAYMAHTCLLYTSPSPRDRTRSRMPSSA